MLAAYTTEEQNKGFTLMGANSLLGSVQRTNDEDSCFSILTTDLSSSECLDSCSFYSGPSDATIMSFGESCESAGVIAMGSTESCGSIAYSGSTESCGSIASSAPCSSSGFSGGCSYSC